MARIRTIKPEFWTSEQVMELSPMARLLFIGLWNFCDDRGVHPAAYKTLKAEVFPADDVTAAQVETWVGELLEQGLLVSFDVNDRDWWSVTGWHHQLINRPSKSRYPEPPRIAPLPSAAGQDDSLSDEPAKTTPKREIHGVLTDDSLTEGKGREVNLKPSSKRSESTTQPPPYPPTAESERAQGPPDPVPVSPEPTAVAPPSPAATAVFAMRSAGIVDGNAGHPKLRALIAAGVTTEDFASAAQSAAQTGKGFAYALGVAEGRHRDAVALAAQQLAQPPPGMPINGKRQTLSEQRRAASLALTGRRTDEPLPERDITAESARLA